MFTQEHVSSSSHTPCRFYMCYITALLAAEYLPVLLLFQIFNWVVLSNLKHILLINEAVNQRKKTLWAFDALGQNRGMNNRWNFPQANPVREYTRHISLKIVSAGTKKIIQPLGVDLECSPRNITVERSNPF